MRLAKSQGSALTDGRVFATIFLIIRCFCTSTAKGGFFDVRWLALSNLFADMDFRFLTMQQGDDKIERIFGVLYRREEFCDKYFIHKRKKSFVYFSLSNRAEKYMLVL